MSESPVGPQQHALIEAFHPSLIKKKPGASGANYVSHSEYQQRLVRALGRMPDFAVQEFIFDDYQERKKDGQVVASATNVITGCKAQMSAVIDGERVTVVEVGDVENPMVNKTNGERAKMAASDAYKRCCLRLAGLGLHMYADDKWVELPEEETPWTLVRGRLNALPEGEQQAFKEWWAAEVGKPWGQEAGSEHLDEITEYLDGLD